MSTGQPHQVSVGDLPVPLNCAVRHELAVCEWDVVGPEDVTRVATICRSTSTATSIATAAAMILGLADTRTNPH